MDWKESNPHEKINWCLTDIKKCLTNIFWNLTNINWYLTDTEKSNIRSIGYIGYIA